MIRLEDRLAPAVFTVNSLLDTATPPAGTTTLRSAIAAANTDHNTDPRPSRHHQFLGDRIAPRWPTNCR